MRITWIAALALSAVVAGCSSPPKVRDCDGEFQPINAVEKSARMTRAQSIAMCKQGGRDGQQS